MVSNKAESQSLIWQVDRIVVRVSVTVLISRIDAKQGADGRFGILQRRSSEEKFAAFLLMLARQDRQKGRSKCDLIDLPDFYVVYLRDVSRLEAMVKKTKVSDKRTCEAPRNHQNLRLQAILTLRQSVRQHSSVAPQRIAIT